MNDGAAEGREIERCRCGDDGRRRSEESVDCVEITAREADILRWVSESFILSDMMSRGGRSIGGTDWVNECRSLAETTGEDVGSSFLLHRTNDLTVRYWGVVQPRGE